MGRFWAKRGATAVAERKMWKTKSFWVYAALNLAVLAGGVAIMVLGMRNPNHGALMYGLGMLLIIGGAGVLGLAYYYFYRRGRA